MGVFFENLEIGDDGTGWVFPSYTPFRSALTGLIRGLRGIANLNTSPGSFYGNIVDFVGQPVHVAFQAGAEAVSSTLFTLARGPNLDRVVEPLTTRLAATASTVDLTIYGTPGTNVLTGSQARVNAVSTPFATGVDTGPLPAIGGSDNYVIEIAEFDVAAELGQTFTLDVDGTLFNHIVGAGDTAQTVIDDLVSQVQVAGLSQGALPAGTSPTTSRIAARIAEGQGLGPFAISFTYTGGAPLPFLFPAFQTPSTAIITGPIEAPSLSVREIVTPVPGWEGVVNTQSATPGRNEETDAELRLRHRANIKSPGSSNPDAIRARVLLPIEQGGGGALSCSVEYNKTDFLDAAGNLPHSIRVVVNEGADGPEVAQAIWDTRSAGDNMNGAIQEFVDDSEGNPQEVLYDELEQVYMWVEATVFAGEGFSQIGDPYEAIRVDIAAHIESLRPGRDVNPIQLPIEVGLDGQDRGVAKYTIRIGHSATDIGPPIYDTPFYPTPEPDATLASQPVLDRQRARGDVLRITITPG